VVVKVKKAKDVEPVIEYVMSGDSLLSGDTAYGSGKRAPGENVGKYKVDVDDVIIRSGSSTTANPNYEVTRGSYDFEILKREITVTAHAASKVYGAADPSSYTYDLSGDGLAAGDSFTGKFAYTGTDAGTYPLTIGDFGISPTANASNYNITFVSANMVISKKAPTITVSIAYAKSGSFGRGDTATVSSVTNGGGSPVWSATSTTCTVDSAGNVVAVAAGSCTITATYASTTNYLAGSGAVTVTVR